MRLRYLFLLLTFIVPQALLAQAGSPIRVTIFLGVNSGCDSTPLDPNVPVDAGSWPLGSLAGPSFCIFNTGSTPVTISNIVVTGTDFSGGHDLLPFTLQPNSANIDFTGANFRPMVAGTRTGQISFVDDAAGSPQVYQLVGTGFTDFGISFVTAPSTTATVNAGQTANYNLEVLRATNPPSPATFSGTITVTCGAMPTGATCSLNPSSFSDTSGPDLLVTVTTTARPAAALRPLRSRFWWALAAVFGIVVTSCRKRQKLLFLFVMSALAFGLISCGGGSRTQPGPGPPGPTPAGTYTFPVTAFSNGISHSRTLTLVVK